MENTSSFAWSPVQKSFVTATPRNTSVVPWEEISMAWKVLSIRSWKLLMYFGAKRGTWTTAKRYIYHIYICILIYRYT